MFPPYTTENGQPASGESDRIPAENIPGNSVWEDKTRENPVYEEHMPDENVPDSTYNEQPRNTGRSGEEKEPGDDKTPGIIVGFISIVFIMLLCVMFTVAPQVNGTVQGSAVSKADVTKQSLPDDLQQIPAATITQIPAITPVIISSTPAPQPVQQVTPVSYVTIEAAPTPTIPALTDITSDIPRPSFQDYMTIYSLTNQPAVSNFPYVSVNLVNPPLIIEYDVTPLNISDTKYYSYKIQSTVYEVEGTNERPYENTWFRVIVRDRNTGKIVLEDGYGRTNSLDTPRKISLYKNGSYRFEFSGSYVTVSLDMKVKKEGNIQ